MRLTAAAPKGVPPYIRPSEVAQASGISKERAETLLRGAGILKKIGAGWFVGESELRERLPELYDRVYWWFTEERGRNQG